MLYLFHCVSGQNHFAALFALHAGNIFDNNNAVLELYRVNRRAGLHFAFAEQTNHKHTALTARTSQNVCQYGTDKAPYPSDSKLDFEHVA